MAHVSVDEVSSVQRGAGVVLGERQEPNPGGSVGATTEPSHDYMRISTGILGDVGAPARTLLQIRPAMHALTDPEGTHARGSVLEVAAISISVEPREGDVRLEQLTAFSQRALVPGSWLRPRRAWALELLGRRGGPMGSETLHTEFRTGLGTARHIGGRAHGYALVTASAYADANRRLAAGPGIELGLTTWHGARLRLGGRMILEQPLGAAREHWQSTEVSARLDVSARSGISLRHMVRPGVRSSAVTYELHR